MARKILVITANRDYLNPTTRLMISLVRELAETYIFGPGFSTVEELERGPEAYAESKEIDWVICDSLVYEWDVFVKRKHPFEMSHICFPEKLYRKHVESMFRFFVDSKYRKLIFGNSDPHVITKETIDTIVQNNIYVVFCGQEMIHPDPNKLENKYGKKFNGVSVYGKFVREYAEQVISIPFFIPETDFCYAPLDHRPLAVSVPGTAYDERKVAFQTLGKLGKPSWWRQKYFRWMVGIMAKLRPASYNRVQMSLGRYGFKALLEDSQRAFVSGSYLEYPVRKYFEVPAAGAVMYCMPFAGMEDMGFVDKENCFFVKDVERLLDMVNAGESMTELQAIADAGRDLIYRCHSLSVRAKQVRECLEAIEEGTFAGSGWRKGKYVINRQEGAGNGREVEVADGNETD